MLKKLLLSISAKLYIWGVKIRHTLFNKGVLKSESFDIPIICVGNITVGGTGKTPMCELLVEHFMQHHKVALLSRGYGRKSKGYREVRSTDSHLEVGDEPLQMKLKYPDTLVVVCEKRVEAVDRITIQHPDIELVIMDDGFQHRHIKPLINIIMVDYTRPVFKDAPLPLGSLRDTEKSLQRADCFIITKCPQQMTGLEMSQFEERLRVRLNQEAYFTRIKNLPPTPLFGGEQREFTPSEQVIALSGIGNPKPFAEMVKNQYNLVEELRYADHHSYTDSDLERIAQSLEANPSAVVLTTEKDRVKLLRMKNIPEDVANKIYYTPIEMVFLSDTKSQLLFNLEQYVKQN